MAKNGKPGKGRVGAVRGRRQSYNSSNKSWVKFDRDSGKILDVKSSPGPFKGVTKS